MTSGLVDQNTTEVAGVTATENPDEGTVTFDLISLQQPQKTDRVLLVHGDTLDTLGTLDNVGESTDIAPPADGSRILVIAVDDDDENPRTVIRDFDPSFSGSTTQSFPTAPKCPDVTYNDSDSDGYWDVDTVYKLQCINEFGLSKDYELVQNIDASDTSQWNDDGSAAKGFEPLGNGDEAFTGEFRGRGYTVKGLYIHRPDRRYVGLFGYVDSGSVDSAELQDIDTTGNEKVGGLVGQTYGGADITNSSAAGDVSGDEYVGGLVGRGSDASIDNSHATTDVSGGDYVGGLVGSDDGDITNSYATGDVSGSGDYIGGLVGSGDYFYSGSIDNSYATGDVTGSGSVGGLIGSGGNVKVYNSHATGDVTGSGNYVGGLVGGADNDVNNSYATGDVTGNEKVGGLSGAGGDNTDNSYATGSVTGNTEVGGLFGYGSAGEGSDVYWMDTSASDDATSANTDATKTFGESSSNSLAEAQGDSAETALDGLDFTDTWRTTDSYPVLQEEA